MNDTAMIFACIPVTVLMGAMMLQQHVEWLRSNSAHHLEYLAAMDAYRAEQDRRVQEAVAWAETLEEPEPLREWTYQRAKGDPEPETGATMEWDFLTYH